MIKKLTISRAIRATRCQRREQFRSIVARVAIAEEPWGLQVQFRGAEFFSAEEQMLTRETKKKKVGNHTEITALVQQRNILARHRDAVYIGVPGQTEALPLPLTSTGRHYVADKKCRKRPHLAPRKRTPKRA